MSLFSYNACLKCFDRSKKCVFFKEKNVTSNPTFAGAEGWINHMRNQPYGESNLKKREGSIKCREFLYKLPGVKSHPSNMSNKGSRKKRWKVLNHYFDSILGSSYTTLAALHTKWSFELNISSVIGHIYWRNPKWKTSFFA